MSATYAKQFFAIYRQNARKIGVTSWINTKIYPVGGLDKYQKKWYIHTSYLDRVGKK